MNVINPSRLVACTYILPGVRNYLSLYLFKYLQYPNLFRTKVVDLAET